MASWKWPNVLNKMLGDIPGINVLLNALLKQDVTGTTDVPAGAKQWVDTPEGKQFQVFNGQSWSSVGKLDHDAASVDGYDASPTVLKNTIPVRDANGDLPGNILGNAKTATKAGALSEVNPVEMGGTGGNTPEKARENLGVPPTDHSSTGTDYGLGNATEYGHNKLSDATDSDLGADGGTAATPLAVKTAKAEAITAAGEALEAFAVGQAAKDDEQDEAIAAAKSSAAAASKDVTALDTTLRQLIAAELAKYLPLAGGTLTGDLGFKLDDLALAVIRTFLVSTRKVCSLYPRNGAEVHLGSMNEGETLHTVACKKLAGPWARAIFGANEYNPDIVIQHGYDEASGAGYIRFSSGILFQWGRVCNISAAPTITTVPLHQPYKNGNYYVNCNQSYNWASGNRPNYTIGIIGLPAATSFNVSGEAGPLGSTWFTLGVGA